MQRCTSKSWALPPESGFPQLGAMSTLARAARSARDGVRILPLVGAPVLPMPEHVRRAVAEAMNRPDPRDTRGLPELRAAISAELAREHGLRVDPERRLLITHGAMQGLSLVLRTVLAPGDEVIVPTPTYFFDGAVREAGARPVRVPSRERDGWALDLAGMEAAVTPRSRAILLCNPTNPTGYLPDAATVEAVVDIAARHGLLVISDDSWQHFTFDGRRYHPVEAFADRWPHLVTVTSLSKYYALASWRLGYVLAPPSIVDALHRRFEWEAVCCGVVPQRAAVATLTGPRDWLDQALSTYQAKRDLVCDGIAASGLARPARPAGGAFLLVDCSRLGDTPAAIDRALLRNGIATVRGADMHAPGTHVRLTFGSDEQTLNELIRGLARACQES
ncbi:pyridoxal phosphate-dependent aminotransferase [Actinomadura decatromicini]|uniref:Pyridoxal phosphate-dependent aminotransferase n=1 Tax=Actinomadura decatromicini TaxID=2604572 RepID=A0A5D3F4H6_9ACTN|nr:pyridoxal phosphate-dependent aminotransferase [Actinomadura decatromicini]TYK43053.1 pyridoxal phosphate-dependent aminotransferase [Actinomadura decatromicini]